MNCLSKYLLRASLAFTSIFIFVAQSLGAPGDSAAGRLEAPEAPLFVVHGSNTIGARLMNNLLQGYFQSKNASGIRVLASQTANEYSVEGFIADRRIYVDVAAHGSSTGFRALLNDQAELAMSSRRIKDSEVQRLSRLGHLQSYNSEHVIGIDGVAIVVHRSNSVEQLSLLQLAAIFSGAVKDWREVGGKAGKINVYARDANSGTWDTFNSLVLGETQELSANAARFESNDELSDLVAQDPNGIGFVGLASVRESKMLAISEGNTAALRPNVLTVATEDYALSRRLFLYTAEDEQNQAVRDFLAFIQTDAGQNIVSETGFVSQKPVSVEHVGSVAGPESYTRLLKYGRRLSVNFRFAVGSAELDNKAKRDVQRIVEFIRRPENQNKRLVLVGFDDAQHAASRALVLSKLRASAIKSQLFKHGVASEPVIGLGDYLPVANNQEHARQKNRRVEVWVMEADPS